MNSISKRLHTIAEFIKDGTRVADIGSDHAYLPTFLVQSGKTNFVIAGEANEGPYQSALKQIKAVGIQDHVDVRKGNGLEVLRQGEVDTIVIAGMGGGLIVQILTEGIEKLKGVQQLVLQPNVGEELVRKFAIEYEWQLSAEMIIEEDERIYEILVFQRGDALQPYRNQHQPLELLLKLGPYLINKKEAAFIKKWKRELTQYETIMEQLLSANQSNAMEKREQLFSEYKQIKEILH